MGINRLGIVKNTKVTNFVLSKSTKVDIIFLQLNHLKE